MQHEKYQEQKAREPWLLAYHLPTDETLNAHKVIKLYTQRMQIEEGFRDTKNGHLGLGLEKENSRSAERFDNLLLIASLILFLLWYVGFASVQLTQSRLLQANTEKRKRVLPIFMLARSHQRCTILPRRAPYYLCFEPVVGAYHTNGGTMMKFVGIPKVLNTMNMDQTGIEEY